MGHSLTVAHHKKKCLHIFHSAIYVVFNWQLVQQTYYRVRRTVNGQLKTFRIFCILKLVTTDYTNGFRCLFSVVHCTISPLGFLSQRDINCGVCVSQHRMWDEWDMYWPVFGTWNTRRGHIPLSLLDRYRVEPPFCFNQEKYSQKDI